MEEWITVNPVIGDPGTTEVKISALPNTGRNTRSTILKFVSQTNPDVMKELPVIQTGLEEYVSFCGIREIVLDPSATDIIVCGITNSSRLTFCVGDGNLNIELPDEYNAGGEITKNGVPIKYDPGKHDEFIFRLQLHIPENTLNEDKKNVLIAKSANAKQACLLITQIHR